MIYVFMIVQHLNNEIEISHLLSIPGTNAVDFTLVVINPNHRRINRVTHSTLLIGLGNNVIDLENQLAHLR